MMLGGGGPGIYNLDVEGRRTWLKLEATSKSGSPRGIGRRTRLLLLMTDNFKKKLLYNN
jgi:hypothetical protein